MRPSRSWRGQSPAPVSGRVFDASDVKTLVDSSLEFWLTTGRYNAQFEARLAKRIGVRSSLTCNSGSSANLLALAALTSPAACATGRSRRALR